MVKPKLTPKMVIFCILSDCSEFLPADEITDLDLHGQQLTGLRQDPEKTDQASKQKIDVAVHDNNVRPQTYLAI